MRIDLHTHSTLSDGTDTPALLVAHAREARLDVLGLTDHDTFAGWERAEAAAARSGLEVVRGVELSCRLGGASVHLLAYRPDPLDADLLEELARIRSGRVSRVPGMVDALRDKGLDVTLDEVLARVGPDGTPGRPHVADALIAKGYAKTRDEAFEKWLAPGMPGYVTRYAPEPAHAVRLVVAAGGAPVLAHPRGRDSAEAMTDDVVAELAEAGLAGLEVDHGEHDAPTRDALRRLARDLDLAVTGGSDYHGTGKVGHELGSEATAPEELERLLARASDNTDARAARNP